MFTPSRFFRAALPALLGCQLGMAAAHNVWMAPDAGGGYIVQFGGHEGRLETYPADKLKSVQAFDRRGREIAVAQETASEGVRVRPAQAAALLAAHFDNGYFSKAGDGPMVNKAMTDHPGASSGVRALKYHKTIIQWGMVARKELGQTFEIVALQADTPHAGVPLRVKVLFEGKPAAGIRLSLGEKGAVVTSAADGTASVVPVAGPNQLLAIRRTPVSGDPRTTSLSYEYLLAFAAH
jgi:nickel transport protein